MQIITIIRFPVVGSFASYGVPTVA